MNKFLIHFSYLLVLSFELVIFMVAGAYGGRYLNENFSTVFNWNTVTIPVSLLFCGYMVFRYLVRIVKIEQKKADPRD